MQIYVTDREKYENLVEENSGVRNTAYEQDLSIKSNAAKEWESSRNLRDIYNFKDKFEHNALTENAKLSFQGKETALLLATTDENGNYTGNLVIPVNPYRGEIHFDKSQLNATDDARFIILNKGDSDTAAEILSLSDLEKAQEFQDQEKTVIIVIDEKDKDIKISDILEEQKKEISESLDLSKDDLKEIDKIAHELMREEEKELSGISQSLEQEKPGNSTKLGRDENNMLRHNPEIESTPKVKELV